MRKTLALIRVSGLMLIVFSAAYLLPMAAALIFDDGTFVDFALAMLLTVAIGYVCFVATRGYQAELEPRDGFVLVVAAWVVMAGFATIPLLLVYHDMSFADAYFETMSGLTTTGASVMSNLDSAPEAINLWRAELNWLGGMGIIVLALAVLPLLGVGGMQLYKAETPGPMKDTKLTPRIAETAKSLWLVYVGITAACIIALKLAGMSWLDAICHAFAAMALGGFSTHDASVGYFNSPTIEFILIVFMLIAAVNFATHFLAWRGRSVRVYLRDPEAHAMLSLVVGSCFAIAFFLWWQGTYDGYFTALRHASFNLVSIATDCGFASVDFDKWPIFAPLWMLFLSCICCSSGSTGGGIKMIRTLTLVRQTGRETVMLLHPAAVNPLRIGALAVPDRVIQSVLGFIFLYFATVVGLTFALVGTGLDFVSSFSAIIACINNMGPGLGVVGPAQNYQPLSDFQIWVCTFAMLAGRLELFTVFVLFTPGFWRK